MVCHWHTLTHNQKVPKRVKWVRFIDAFREERVKMENYQIAEVQKLRKPYFSSCASNLATTVESCFLRILA